MKLQEQDTEGLLLQETRIFQVIFTLNTFPKDFCIEITVFRKLRYNPKILGLILEILRYNFQGIDLNNGNDE